MSEVFDALNRLNGVLDNLETAAVDQQAKVTEIRAIGQQDLFNAKSRASNDSANVIHVDPSAVANKLDNAIEKIEQVLKEG